MKNIPTRREDVISKNIDEQETMLYDPETETLYVLNATAELVWELCDGGHTPADMVVSIRAQYTDAQDDDVLDDVSRTLEIFATRGLLQTVEAAV